MKCPLELTAYVCYISQCSQQQCGVTLQFTLLFILLRDCVQSETQYPNILKFKYQTCLTKYPKNSESQYYH